MTEELLAQANNLKARIKEVDELLAQIDLTDDSGNDPTPRFSPLMIQAGMAHTVQFDIMIDNTTEVQRLDSHVYKTILTILQDYRKKLQEMFDNLK